jgi:hypothetical protein
MASFDGGSDLLAIQSIKASAEKVDRVCFHPVEPLLAFADRANRITVWNFESNEVRSASSRLYPPLLGAQRTPSSEGRRCAPSLAAPPQGADRSPPAPLNPFSLSLSLSLSLRAQVVYTNQLGGADEGALQEAALRARADKDAAALGAPPPPPPPPPAEASLAAKAAASGAVRDLAFFDLDTCFWQLATQRALQYGAYDASGVPTLGALRALRARRWLLAACDNKVTLHDLSSAASLDISRAAAFESRAPTRLAFLLLNAASLTGFGGGGGGAGAPPEVTPVLAVGVSSGAIFLVDPTTMAVYAKLAGGHKGAVTALLPLGSPSPGGPDRLISASADGSVAVWDPSRTPARGADREMAPAKTFKAHDGAVRSAALFVAHGVAAGNAAAAPSRLPLRLATAGEDKKVALWDVATWAQLARCQPLPPKAGASFVGWAPWGGAGLGAHPSLVVASGESAAVMGLDPATLQARPMIDLQGRIDPGQKKSPKVYHAAVHPTR